MIGKTTLMVLAVTPRALVLASLTGVGALLAPDGAATPNAAALATTATAPPARNRVRSTPDLHHRRIAVSPEHAVRNPGSPAEGYSRRVHRRRRGPTTTAPKAGDPPAPSPAAAGTSPAPLAQPTEDLVLDAPLRHLGPLQRLEPERR